MDNGKGVGIDAEITKSIFQKLNTEYQISLCALATKAVSREVVLG